MGSGSAIGGPLGKLLANSTDLGPSQGRSVQVTVALRSAVRPTALLDWAVHHKLSVRWRDGDDFAYVEGAPADFGDAFGIAVHDYRGPDGRLFYASTEQPGVPTPVRADVSELGRVLSYHPVHRA